MTSKGSSSDPEDKMCFTWNSGTCEEEAGRVTVAASSSFFAFPVTKTMACGIGRLGIALGKL